MRWLQRHESLHRIILACIFLTAVVLYVAGQVSQLFVTLVIALASVDVMLLVITNDLNKRAK